MSGIKAIIILSSMVSDSDFKRNGRYMAEQLIAMMRGYLDGNSE